MAHYRSKPEYVEAVKFTGQTIPGLVCESGMWLIRDGRSSFDIQMGDYVYLQGGRAVGRAEPRYFESRYEEVE